MRLSKLQKFILERCYESRNGSENKNAFYGFYAGGYLKANKKIVQDTVHQSLDSLVEKDMLAAFGKKTSERWFIEKVRLTPSGRKKARELFMAKQRKLPIK